MDVSADEVIAGIATSMGERIAHLEVQLATARAEASALRKKLEGAESK